MELECYLGKLVCNGLYFYHPRNVSEMLGSVTFQAFLPHTFLRKSCSNVDYANVRSAGAQNNRIEIAEPRVDHCGLVWIDTGVREEELDAAVIAHKCRDVQWRYSFIVGKVWINTWIRQEELDISSPSPTALIPQKGSPQVVLHIYVQAGHGKYQLHSLLVNRLVLGTTWCGRCTVYGNSEPTGLSFKEMGYYQIKLYYRNGFITLYCLYLTLLYYIYCISCFISVYILLYDICLYLHYVCISFYDLL